jgi:hypothetical protein
MNPRASVTALNSQLAGAMSRIMCSQRMWRVVRQWEPKLRTERTSEAVLGPWAAKTWSDGGRELVLALETSTYLTLVFPFGSASEFHAAGAGALQAILEDIGVPAQRIALEIAHIGSAPLTRLQDSELSEALKTAQFMCDIELLYHSDLRRVQANLSEFPHAPPPHYVAAQNARWLFGHRQAEGH